MFSANTSTGIAIAPSSERLGTWSQAGFVCRSFSIPVGVLGSAIFLLALGVRLIYLDQPLCENFIDRQVHTAMIARNLIRGGSLLYPEIDIGPYPAYYMLEFPGYPALAGAVSVVAGIELDAAGRLCSALATALACLLLFDLVRRHDGALIGLLAACVFAIMPVMVRYGRAFQPDAAMLACVVSSLWAADRWARCGKYRWLVIASLSAGAALLLKVIAAYLLLPLAYLAWKRHGLSLVRRWDMWAALAVALLPAAAWYVHAWHVAAHSATVSTPFWYAHKWVSLDRLVDPGTYRQLAYFIGWRVLTPVGALLAVLGAIVREPTDNGRAKLFHIWLASLATYFPILVRKVDHEHYYLALAPVASVFAARALAAIARAPLTARCYVNGPVAAASLGLGLLTCDALASRSTFRVPTEWRSVAAAAASARECTPSDALVAAHSSVLLYADRRGFTFAYGRDEIDYLLATWGDATADRSPTGLVEFYRRQGAEFFVELLGTNRERDNPEFFDYVRSHYETVRDETGRFIVISLNAQSGSTADIRIP